jgi:hypothetical protein
MLSDNYTAVAQTVNLLAEWLIQAGMAQSVSDSNRGILRIQLFLSIANVAMEQNV